MKWNTPPTKCAKWNLKMLKLGKKRLTFTKHAFLDTFLVAFFFWFWSESRLIFYCILPMEMHHHFTHDFQRKSLLVISWQLEELQEAVSCISFLDCNKSLARCGVARFAISKRNNNIPLQHTTVSIPKLPRNERNFPNHKTVRWESGICSRGMLENS